MIFLKKKYSFQPIFLLLIIFSLFNSACTGPKEEEIDAVEDRSTLPGLSVSKITTVISDSGVTRYRIAADDMEIFDRKKEPYWEFKKGLYFERFDHKLKVDANFRSNYAKYYERKRLWEFKGKVKAINIDGQMIESELLFWDQNQKKIYTDKPVKITRLDDITYGAGFESNETMTKWRIKQAQSDIYFKEE